MIGCVTIWGRRTKEENDDLVQKGVASRNSEHLRAKAVDMINRDDPYPDDPQNAYYQDLKAAVERQGLKGGGSFKSRWDPTHFEAR